MRISYCDECEPTPEAGPIYTPTVPGIWPPKGPWKTGPSVENAQGISIVRTDDGRIETNSVCTDCVVTPSTGPVISPTIGNPDPVTGPRLEYPPVSVDIAGPNGITAFLSGDGEIDFFCGDNCKVPLPTSPSTPTIPYPIPPIGPKREFVTVDLQLADAEAILIAANEDMLVLTGLPPLDCYGTGESEIVARIQIPWSGSMFECETFRDVFQRDSATVDFLWETSSITAEIQAGAPAAPQVTQGDVIDLNELQGRYTQLFYTGPGILAACAGDDCFEPSPQPLPECYFGCCDWPMQPICSIGAALLYQYATSPDSNVDDSISQSFEQFRLYGEQFMRSSQ